MVPRPPRYYGALRPPAAHPGGLVDSPAGTALALLLSLPPPASATHGGPGFWSAGSPTGILRYGDDRISRVPVRSSRCMPCSLQTPVGPKCQAIRHSRCCLPPLTRRRLPPLVDFGAPSHGLHHRCLRFATAVTRTSRKTRFRAVASLTRAGFDPQDLFGRFPSDSSHAISSPFPELCSAHARADTLAFSELEGRGLRPPLSCRVATLAAL